MNRATAYRSRIRGDRAANLEEAIRGYEAALEVRTREATPVDWATAQMNRATAYLSRIRGDRAANLEEAIRGYEAALEVMTREAMPVDWATAQMNRATAYSDRIRGDGAANLEEAIRGYEAALEVWTREAMPVDHLKCLRGVGGTRFRQQQWGAANGALSRLGECLDDLYDSTLTEDTRQELLRTVGEAPLMRAFAMLKIDNKNAGASTAVLENGRSKWLAGTFQTAGLELERLDQTQQAEFEQLRAEESRLRAELRENVSGSRYGEVTDRLRSWRSEWAELRERIVAAVPDFFPPDIHFGAIQHIAARGTLVYLGATEPGGVAVMVGTDGRAKPTWLDELKLDEVNARLIAYFTAYSNARQNRTGWEAQIDEVADWLGVVLAPLWDQLKGEPEAVLIPFGHLGLLPLHMARRPDPMAKTGYRYLLDDVVIRYSPAAKALATNRKADRPLSLLAIDEPIPVTANPLRNSNREVTAVASHFPGSLPLRGEAATKAAVLREISNHGVLHFSCHGTSNLRSPLDAGLLLANDAMLTLREVLPLELSLARLAVLSACETGWSGMDLPDETVGLPAGLMQAGVGGVVATLWSVLDASTMMVMVRFYELWRDEGLPPATALRDAQVWMRDTTNDEKTAYFAGHMPQLGVTRMPADLASDAFRLVGVLPRDERSFAHPYHWAGIGYSGV